MIKMTKEESEDLDLLVIRINTALESMNSTLISGIDIETPMDVLAGYYYGATNFLADTKIAEHMWRKKMVEKYNLPYAFHHNGQGEIFEEADMQNKENSCGQ